MKRKWRDDLRKSLGSVKKRTPSLTESPFSQEPFSIVCCHAPRVSGNLSTRSPLKTAIVIQNNSPHTPPLPQIRILKRPSNNGLSGLSQGQNRPAPQVKSLAQREAEYAEARKRILGSAGPEGTPPEKPNTERPRHPNSATSPEDRSNNHAVSQPSAPDGMRGFCQNR